MHEEEDELGFPEVEEPSTKPERKPKKKASVRMSIELPMDLYEGLEQLKEKWKLSSIAEANRVVLRLGLKARCGIPRNRSRAIALRNRYRDKKKRRS